MSTLINTDWIVRLEVTGQEPADIRYATAASARNAYTVIANANHPKITKLVLLDPEGRVEALRSNVEPAFVPSAVFRR